MKQRCRRALAALLLAGLAAPAAPAGDARAAAAEDFHRSEFDCLMDAAQRIKLGAPIPGLIREVLVARGDVVRRGQVVARLAAEVEEANAALARVRALNDAPLASAELRADYTRRRAQRLERLRATQAVSEREYDEALTEARVAAVAVRDAQMNLEAARAELRRAEEQVAQRRVLSPLDGVVAERHLGPGEHLHEQAQILTVAQIDPLHVEVYLPAAFLRRVAVGQRAVVLPEEPVGGRHEARVQVVDQVLDAASGTFGVRLLLPNPELALPAGLRCRVRFPAG